MKLWKKLWADCKPCVWILFSTIVVFLILMPLSVSPAGIRLGNMALPVRINGDIVNGIYSSIFGALIPVLTWISLILFAGESKRPFVRIAIFQAGLLAIVLVPFSFKLRHLPSFHTFLVTIIFLFTVDGILKLFSWLFHGSRTAAAVAMACIQLAGPLVLYMNDFRDFFPPSLARMASISYLEFPFYQKAVSLLKEGSLSPLIPDLILAIVILGISLWIHVKQRDK
ncbi:MAG: hypothetical protein GXO70_01665 [Acidobacteria bacterium]|nr:hypothetical protein [Acidobacteriota bacterium]